MILVLKFSNPDSGTVLVVQQLRLHVPKHRKLGSTHGRRTKITHALEQLRVDTTKKKKKRKKKNADANLTFRPNTHISA